MVLVYSSKCNGLEVWEIRREVQSNGQEDGNRSIYDTNDDPDSLDLIEQNLTDAAAKFRSFIDTLERIPSILKYRSATSNRLYHSIEVDP